MGIVMGPFCSAIRKAVRLINRKEVWMLHLPIFKVLSEFWEDKLSFPVFILVIPS